MTWGRKRLCVCVCEMVTNLGFWQPAGRLSNHLPQVLLLHHISGPHVLRKQPTVRMVLSQPFSVEPLA